ncbi:hypothetical protein D3C77_431140 [compost metagenome]
MQKAMPAAGEFHRHGIAGASPELQRLLQNWHRFETEDGRRINWDAPPSSANREDYYALHLLRRVSPKS